jgi:hypothetical protein
MISKLSERSDNFSGVVILRTAPGEHFNHTFIRITFSRLHIVCCQTKSYHKLENMMFKVM